MVEYYLSNGWSKPYCYTIVDMHKVIKGPIKDKTGIMDGGYYVYKKYDWFNKQNHIKWLLESEFKFIFGIDYMPYEEREPIIELLLKHNKNVYPSVKSMKDWDWLHSHKNWKFEGISTKYKNIIKLAKEKGYNIHHMGHVINKENLNHVTSLDVNPYMLKKSSLLDLGSDRILKLDKELLKLGEFILYGSSLFVGNPNDIDLLYYGDLSEKEIINIVRTKTKNDKINILKYDSHYTDTGKVTHLLYAIDNGVCLNECPSLKSMYDNFSKKLSNHQLLYKHRLAYNYFKDSFYDKEIKTLIVAYKYYYNDKLSNYLYDYLHCIYKIVGDYNKRSEMLFNRSLFSKFGRIFVVPTTNRTLLYRKNKFLDIIDLFFPKVDHFVDDEQFLMKMSI